MNKITNDHLSRAAYVYIRQSTPGQLINNKESRRRQYGLAERAKALGWQNVNIVDEDLGRSGDGTARSGFDRLLTAVCAGTAGAVFAIECSRLARNGREWHTLLEFCGLVNCLIIDDQLVYDPKLTDDRLVLGLKGTYSEFELSILRQRSLEALRLKAARGDLYRTVAVGYVRTADNRLEMDPDKRVREAIHLAFRKFVEFGSIRQVALWLIDEGIKMPVAVYGPEGRVVEWRLPRYNTLYRVLTNPIYAGVYAYGQTASKVRLEGGRKLIVRNMRRPQADWDVLIRDHHEGYIRWEEYRRNQQIINGNANRKGAIVPGSVRSGDGLLAGLLRCGHCGRKLKVHNAAKGVVRYECNDAARQGLRTACIGGFGNLRIDAAVSAEVLRVIAPLGLDAAVQTIAERERCGTEQLRQRDRWTTSSETEQLIRDLARVGPDRSIASILNRLGVHTATGLTWTEGRVRGFRRDHQIAVHREGERAERGEVVLREAATRLGVSKMTVVRLIKDGLLPAKQACIGAPYVILQADLDRPEVKRAIANARAVSADPRQGTLDYQ